MTNRTLNILKHLKLSFIYKFLTLALNFMLVPISLNYLGAENYGVWIVISSFVGWFAFLDIGLGNGLRNKFAEAKVDKNYKDIKYYVSTAYYSISALSLIIFFIFLVISSFVDWSLFFNTNGSLKEDLDLIMILIFGSFSLQLCLKLIISIYQADQNHSIVYLLQFITQFITVISIIFLANNTKDNLVAYSFIVSSVPILILIVMNVFGFKTFLKDFRPRILYFHFSHLLKITNLGFKFFVIQISAIIMFSTDNFLISKLLGPEEVVPYSVSFKYYSIVLIIYSIVAAPFWSAFTEAFAQGDIEWIKVSVSKVQRIWRWIPLILLCMTVSAKYVFSLWIGTSIFVPSSLNVLMAIYVLISTYNMIYSSFINGIGKVKLNLYFSILSALINIPLSILLGVYFNLGVNGIILATCICLGYGLPFLPIQYNKLISGSAKGIWNE